MPTFAKRTPDSTNITNPTQHECIQENVPVELSSSQVPDSQTQHSSSGVMSSSKSSSRKQSTVEHAIVGKKRKSAHNEESVSAVTTTIDQELTQDESLAGFDSNHAGSAMKTKIADEDEDDFEPSYRTKRAMSAAAKARAQ
jgi:hypothetical protein